MKKAIFIIFIFAVPGPAHAQLFPGTISAQSQSGQFIVFAPLPMPFVSRPREITTNASLIFLEPPLLAISCERIKQLLYRELDAPASWQGRVFLSLHRAQSADEQITVVSEKFPGGWNYRVHLPDALERFRFTRVIVEILLREMANRHADDRSAEIPAWLSEGLTQELLASNEAEFILPTPQGSAGGLAVSRVIVNSRMLNSLEQVQKNLLNHAPLTLEELSWPKAKQSTGEAAGIYRSSAQLFVHQLLGLKNGPARLRAMLDTLPNYYNWQLAFLNAFPPDFQNLRDVERWWALQLVPFTGRDLMQTLTLDESFRRLDYALRLPVEVRTGPNELPLHTDVTLQTIIRDWERARQAEALRRKLRELELVRLRIAQDLARLVDDYRTEALRRKLGEEELLRMRIAQDLVPLVDDYHRAIETYLEQRDNSGYVASKMQASPNARLIIEDILKQLDALDLRREALRSSLRQNPAVTGKEEPVSATIH